jgi:hypothetical protein
VGESNLGGTPTITVNAATKVITLDFRGPAPTYCTLIYMPVDGLQGQFGPLEAGDWEFISLSRDLGLDIHFTVTGKKVHHVDGDAPGPAHNGKTWTTAYLTLQDALAAVVGGDEIVMAEGTYKPDRGTGVTAGDRDASFELTAGITIRGGFAGYGQPDPDARDIAAHKTILSGDLNGDDLWHLLNRDDNSYHVLIGPSDGALTTLDGLFVADGTADGRFPNDLGGGLYNPGGTMIIVNCTFQNNTAGFGGGILNLDAGMTLVNTQLIGNRAFTSGGGLYNWEGDVILHNCRVVGNSADRAADMHGAAIDNLTANLAVLDSTIADNLSPNGGAVSSYTWDSDAGTITITNSILYNGGHEVSSDNMPAVSITYSDVQGGATGTGNLSVAPLFVAPGVRSIEGEWVDGDYHLQATSSCIDAGNDGALPADVADLDGNGNVTEPLPVDLDGTARIQGSHVDMGAYEQLAKKPGPGLDIELTAAYGGKQIVLAQDPVSPDTFTGSLKVGLDTDLKLRISVDVTATSAAGGTWTGWAVPDTISPPGGTFTIWVKGQGMDLSALPSGSKSVQVADVELTGQIIP